MTEQNQELIKPEHNLLAASEDAAKQTVAFGLLYHAADVEWIGGALVGNWLTDRYGVNPWIAAAGVASAVGITEYNLSNVAVKTFEKKEDIERNPSRLMRGVQEIGGLAYAAFAGSANGVKINDSLGLESTKTRRKVQAAVFGGAVGLWVTPLPGYEDGADFAKERVQEMIEDPKTFILYSLISIGTILGASKVVKEGRKAFDRFREKRNSQTA